MEGSSTGKRKLTDLSDADFANMLEEKRIKKQKGADSSSPLTPELPEDFVREIAARSGDGRRAFLVIQKKLYDTDVDTGNSRLHMPCNQVKGLGFLESHEVKRLRNEEEIEVSMLHKPEPNGDGGADDLPIAESPLSLKLRNLHKHKELPQKMSWILVLIRGWNTIVSEDNLKEGNTIQIWAYRDRQKRLGLAIVKVKEMIENADSWITSHDHWDDPFLADHNLQV